MNAMGSEIKIDNFLREITLYMVLTKMSERYKATTSENTNNAGLQKIPTIIDMNSVRTNVDGTRCLRWTAP